MTTDNPLRPLAAAFARAGREAGRVIAVELAKSLPAPADPAVRATVHPAIDPLDSTGPGELVVHFGPRGGLLGVTMHGEPLPYKVVTCENDRFPGPDLRPIVVRRAKP